jgi:hypothetical protein
LRDFLVFAGDWISFIRRFCRETVKDYLFGTRCVRIHLIKDAIAIAIVPIRNFLLPSLSLVP